MIFMVCRFWYFLLWKYVLFDSNRDESNSPLTGTITSSVVALNILKRQNGAQAS